MKKHKKSELAAFAKRVLEIAVNAGAELFDDHGTQSFRINSPLGLITGSILWEKMIAMRFDEPGANNVPPVGDADFNRHSHKWNIQNPADLKESLAEFERRMARAAAAKINHPFI